uniref:Uncharacterized protein n=1 Tax=Eucampia antarctica TaxID=49252 RepID=A0A7S2RW08_9STRA
MYDKSGSCAKNWEVAGVLSFSRSSDSHVVVTRDEFDLSNVLLSKQLSTGFFSSSTLLLLLLLEDICTMVAETSSTDATGEEGAAILISRTLRSIGITSGMTNLFDFLVVVVFLI